MVCLALGCGVAGDLLSAPLTPKDPVVGAQTFPAGNTTQIGLKTVTTSGAVILPSGAKVTFRAGNRITLAVGFSVQPGATLALQVKDIDTDVDGIPDLIEESLSLDADDADDVLAITRQNTSLSNGTGLWSSSPLWWRERSVILPDVATDNYAAVNQGQLKNVAKQTYEALKGAGILDEAATAPAAAQTELMAKWKSPSTGGDNYVAINLGQLKAVAAPFYQHLYNKGYLVQLPSWLSNPSHSMDNFALVNSGQLKNLFSFNFDNLSPFTDGPGYRYGIEGVPAGAWRIFYGTDKGSLPLNASLTAWDDDRGLSPLSVVTPTAPTPPRWIQAEGGLRAISLNGTATAGYLKSNPLPFGTGISNAFSVICLVRPTGTSTSVPQFEVGVGDPVSFRLWADATAPNRLRVSAGSGAVLDNTPEQSFRINQWQYWVFVFENGTGRLYRDGELMATRTGMIAPKYWLDLRVGRNSAVWISELAILSQSLTATQVSAYGDVLRARYPALFTAANEAGPSDGLHLSIPVSGTSQLNGNAINISIGSPVEGQIFN